MAGHVGEFDRGAQEAAALPLRMPRRTGEVAEDALDLGRQAVLALGEPLLEQRQIGLVAAGEIGRYLVVLAPEMILQRALSDAGFRRHRVDADAPYAVIVEQRIRRDAADLGRRRRATAAGANSRAECRFSIASIKGMPPAVSGAGNVIFGMASPFAGMGRSRPMAPSASFVSVFIAGFLLPIWAGADEAQKLANPSCSRSSCKGNPAATSGASPVIRTSSTRLRRTSSMSPITAA
jgi:hypothetical protein